MDAIESGPLPVTDTDISRDQALVRGLVVRRLEMVWRSCEPHLQVQVDPDSGLVLSKPDPRFVEAGMRAIRDLARVYRLDQPASADPSEGSVPVSVRSLVEASLRELEQRMNPQGSSSNA